MRHLTPFILAAGIAAAPAAAQQIGETTAMEPVAVNTADGSAGAVDTSAGANAPMNGLAPGPTEITTTTAAPPTSAAPGVIDATVTPETGEGGGFPWGILGLLGLLGLIGRFRS